MASIIVAFGTSFDLPNSIARLSWSLTLGFVLPPSVNKNIGNVNEYSVTPPFVIWPTMSCFADWQEHSQMTFITIEWWTCRHVTTHHHLLISVNEWCVTTKATVSKSQNVKDRSHANKYLRKIKVNLISTYSNAGRCMLQRHLTNEVKQHSANCWRKLKINYKS